MTPLETLLGPTGYEVFALLLMFGGFALVLNIVAYPETWMPAFNLFGASRWDNESPSPPEEDDGDEWDGGAP